MIGAILKVLLIWTAVSVSIGLLIAPALARQLRRKDLPPKIE